MQVLKVLLKFLNVFNVFESSVQVFVTIGRDMFTFDHQLTEQNTLLLYRPFSQREDAPNG